MTGIAGEILRGLIALGGFSVVPALPADTVTGPGRDVPFVAQTPLLCGGAAAAMIERYHGARGVHGDAYEHLVRIEDGGIRTSELASAMTARGYRVTVSQGDPEKALHGLREGLPSILLLEGGDPALHYVVLVGLEGDTVWFHDPNFGPMRRASREDLLDRWAASRYWSLRAEPAAGSTPGAGAGYSGEGPPPPDSVEFQPEGSPQADSAMALLRDGRYEAARRIVSPLLHMQAENPLARRIAATAHFLEGETDQALVEWNILGEPRVDLVQIQGLEHTRYHAAAQRVGLDPRALLTPRRLNLARRRLSQLPALDAARVDYQPLVGGDVEVRASVRERSRWPSPLVVGVRALGAAVNRSMWIEAGPFMGAGEIWRAGGSWEAAQSYVVGEVASPAPPVPGVVTVGIDWRRERFAVPPSEGDEVDAVAEEWSRMRASLAMEEWVGGDTRLGGGAALERWEAGERMVAGALTGRQVLAADGVVVDGRIEGWTGELPAFGRWEVSADVEIPHGPDRAWRLQATGAGVLGPAPALIWPGAGTGRLREPLLRGHPLEKGGAIAGAALGRRLLQGTVEYRIFKRIGPVRAGGFVFMDAARVWATRSRGAPRTLADPGLGLLLDTGSREVTLSLARGGSDWVISMRVSRRH